MKYTAIWEIPISCGKTEENLNYILEHSKSRQIFLATPNPEMLLASNDNTKFKQILQTTNLNIPDGIGLLWAATYLNSSKKNRSRIIKLFKAFYYLSLIIFRPSKIKNVIPERVTGTDFMQILCKKLRNRKVFFLGGKPGIAKAAGEKMTRECGIKFVGYSAALSTDPSLVDEINISGAEVLFVAFGAPKQEIWIHENLPHLKKIKIAVGVGGAFDFISGNISRAPNLLRKMGLEWLYRLFKEPKRLNRIFNATVKFPYYVIVKSF